MKLVYSLCIVFLIMPICLGYAYQSKQHWNLERTCRQSIVETDLSRDMPPVVVVPKSIQPTDIPNDRIITKDDVITVERQRWGLHSNRNVHKSQTWNYENNP
jgi:hypothetical protein